MKSPALPFSANSHYGFTLTELAIVLVIVSLLAGGLMMSIGAQMELKDRAETQQRLQDARDALLGYAATHSAADGKPYLPCPDTDGDGLENRSGTTCTSDDGVLPWNNLGVAALDAWGNRFRYHIHNNFSRTDVGITLTTSAPNLQICDQAACSSTVATALPAIIISHGKNGFGAVNAANTANPAPPGADEIENTNGNRNFVSHTPTPAGSDNEFDDMVTWLSPNILYNRLITAGRLP